MIWRSLVFRLTAVPLALIGIAGAMAGEKFDIAIAPAGDAVAVRSASGRLTSSADPDLFAAEQWLSAAGDARLGRRDDRPAQARGRSASAAL